MSSQAGPNTISAIPPPPGRHSNLIDPPSIDSTVLACSVLLLVLSTPWVAVRLYTRIQIKPKVWWDDLTCVVGWAFMVALAALNIHMLEYGSGSSLWDVTTADWMHMKSHFNSILIVARVGLTITKISFLLLYQRLFITAQNCFTPIWWSIWITFWCNIIFAVAYAVAVTTKCVGKAAVVAKGGQCIDEYAILISSSFINVAMDIAVLVIPIVAIWGLQVPKAKKRRLSAVFVLGGLAVLSSVARLGYQFAVAESPNQSIAFTVNSLLKLIEQSIGVIVSCMPIFPAFYQHLRSAGSTTRSKSLGKSKSGGEAAASILGYERRGRGFVSRLPTNKSKAKDPFPVDWTMDDKMTTRAGYEELAELEKGTPGPAETGKEWGVPQARLSRVLEGAGPVPQAHNRILKGTEVEITFEPR
ncbi:MAG: hypothetical protein Q9208_001724 [Pyrenodesmia sp. 3 TL-2023]